MDVWDGSKYASAAFYIFPVSSFAYLNEHMNILLFFGSYVVTLVTWHKLKIPDVLVNSGHVFYIDYVYSELRPTSKGSRTQ